MRCLMMNAMQPFHLVSLDVPDAGAFHVLILADDPLARTGLAALLADQPGYVTSGAAPADQDLAAALRLLAPDVVLWDWGLRTAPEPNLEDLHEADVPVVVLLADDALVPEAWAAGARGLLHREAAPTTITAALTAVWQGLLVVDPALVEAWSSLQDLVLPDASPAHADLTPREVEVLKLLAEGLPNKLIADRLSISEHTAKFHVGSILSKLGAQSRTEAVVRAARLGLFII